MVVDMQKHGHLSHRCPCLFKCIDFNTEIIGRYDAVKNEFYVERGDGTKYSYGIEWFKELEIKKC
jgi:hypothetical protein